MFMVIENQGIHSPYTLYHPGVVNSKWHKKVKVSPQARMMLSQTNGEPEFEKREAIFASNRAVLCSEFRYTNFTAFQCKNK